MSASLPASLLRAPLFCSTSPLRRKLADLQREDLFSFLWSAFDVLHKDRGEAFVPNWHLKAMCYELTRVAAGDERRLLITIPPRHLKTVTASVAFVAWLIGRNPALRIIIASYGQVLAGKNLADLRQVFESDLYRRVFPGITVQATGPTLNTNRGGVIRATSVTGAITGIGADFIVADDLLKAGDAGSPQMREDAFTFYQHSLLSRLDNKSEGGIVMVQQRLHADDVAGRLLEAGGFRHLNLPAIAEEDQTIAIGPGSGPNAVHHRRVGDVLFPQREPKATLDELRTHMGSGSFVPQYQQRTDGAGSDLFRWAWFGTYDERPHRDECNMVVQSIDTAFADGANNDYSVCLTWGRRNTDWYLLDVLRTRDSYSDVKSAVVKLATRWQTDRLIIEQAGAGIPLLRELTREHNLRGRVFAYKPRVSKTERFTTQIERLRDGCFRLPAEAPWLADFQREMTSFPNGKHDDQVDALVQFLDWLGNRQAQAMMHKRNGHDRRRQTGSSAWR